RAAHTLDSAGVGLLYLGVRADGISRRSFGRSVSRKLFRMRTGAQFDPAPTAGSERRDLHRGADRNRAGFSRLDRSVVPPGLSDDGTRRSALRSGFLPQIRRAPALGGG